MELREINATQVLEFGKLLQAIPTNGLDCSIKLYRSFIMGNPEGAEYGVISGLYSHWLGLDSPAFNHDNWANFVEYVNANGGLLDTVGEGVEVPANVVGSDIPQAV